MRKLDVRRFRPRCGLKKDNNYLPWSHAEERLTKSRNYWILLDLDGLTDGRIRFRCGASGSRAHCTSAQHAGRGWRATLRASPWCRCTLESGDDVVILEGEAVEVSDQSTLKKLDAASRANYKMPLMLVPGSVL